MDYKIDVIGMGERDRCDRPRILEIRLPSDNRSRYHRRAVFDHGAAAMKPLLVRQRGNTGPGGRPCLTPFTPGHIVESGVVTPSESPFPQEHFDDAKARALPRQ